MCLAIDHCLLRTVHTVATLLGDPTDLPTDAAAHKTIFCNFLKRKTVQ